MSSKQDKRRQIIEAAAQVLERYGLRKTTMEDIAERCGLRKASLYYYFKSKEEIVAAVVESVADKDFADLRARTAAAPTAAEALVAIAAQGRRRAPSHTMEFVMLLGTEDLFALLPAARASYERMQTALADVIRGILNRGVEGGEFVPHDTAALAASLRRMLFSMFLGRLVANDGTLEEQQRDARLILQRVSQGLRVTAE